MLRKSDWFFRVINTVRCFTRKSLIVIILCIYLRNMKDDKWIQKESTRFLYLYKHPINDYTWSGSLSYFVYYCSNLIIDPKALLEIEKWANFNNYKKIISNLAFYFLLSRQKVILKITRLQEIDNVWINVKNYKGNLRSKFIIFEIRLGWSCVKS